MKRPVNRNRRKPQVALSARPLAPGLPSRELDCMRAIWEIGRGTVREIRARLDEENPLAYTTVLTLMDRLHRKGVVRRERRGKAFCYSPLYKADEARRDAVRRVLETYFEGSRSSLVRFLEMPSPPSSGAKRAGRRRNGAKKPASHGRVRKRTA